MSEIDNKNFVNQKERNLQIQGKITIIKDWIYSFEAKICKQFNLTRDQFKISSTFSANGGMICQSNENSISINVDVNKYLNASSLELFALISSNVYRSSLYKNLLEAKSKQSQNEEENQEPKDEDEKKSDESVRKAKRILQKHIESYLKKIYHGQLGEKALSEKEIKEYASNISSLVIESGKSYNLGEKSIEQLLENYLDVDQLKQKASDGNSIDINKLSEDDVYVSRVSKLNNLAETYYADPATVPTAISYAQQAKELETLSATCKFSDLSDSNDLMGLCEAYASKFMASNGLNPIKVVFNNSIDEFGQFVEKGNGNQEIRINTSKASSKSELLMTLSHELTHAVEASINKGQGIHTLGGSGLNRSIDQSVGIGRSDSNYDFMKKLNNYCYHLNPHERSARIGEISGLMFAQNVYENDKDSEFKNQIQKSIISYQNFQQKTIDMAQNLDNFLSEVNDMLPSLSGKAREIAEKKYDYLIGLKQEILLETKGDFNNMEEFKSIKEVQKINNEINVNKKNEEKQKQIDGQGKEGLNSNELDPEEESFGM